MNRVLPAEVVKDERPRPVCYTKIYNRLLVLESGNALDRRPSPAPTWSHPDAGASVVPPAVPFTDC